MIRTTSLVACTVLVLLAGGCGEEFPPYNRLASLRVLAIQSDPVVPAPGEQTRLVPLIYTPPGETATYRWSWCPLPGSANQGYPCLLTEAQLAEVLGPGTPVPSYQLGTEPTAALTIDLPVAALRALCEGAGAQAGFRPDCADGFPVQVKLEVATATNTVTAVRTLRLRIEEGQAHANPRPTGLTVKIGSVHVPLNPMTLPTIPRFEKTIVRTLIDHATDAEPYTAIDRETGAASAARETLLFTWFVESGETAYPRTVIQDGVLPPLEGPNRLRDPLENEWKPSRVRDYGRATASLIVVVRDNRGGVGWISGAVRLEASP